MSILFYIHFLASTPFLGVSFTLFLLLQVLKWAVSVWWESVEHYGVSLASGVLCWEGYNVHCDGFFFLAP